MIVRRPVACLAIALVALCAWAGSARAAVVATEGADTVTTPRFELDFGDSSANVEWVQGLKWRPSTAVAFGSSIAASGGGGCGDATEFWGQSYGNADGQGPGPVVAGSRGSWEVRGRRTVEISSIAPEVCSGDTPPVPVRTRYSFFDEGPSANLIRMERRWSFSPLQEPYAVQGMRAYVPRLPSGTYNQEIYPKGDGELVTSGICNVCVVTGADWNGKWVALNSSATNAGMMIIRAAGNSSPASITLDFDSSSGSNNTGVSLDRPLPNGWTAPLTETEFLCFYDATTWPVAERSATRLPDGCAEAVPPIITEPPALSAGAGNPRVGERFFASPGKWENATGTFTYQWSRCLEDVCQQLPTATGTEYTATSADVGHQLKVAVTATGVGGETDVAESNVAGAVSGHVFEGSRTGPAVAGARVQVCRRSGSPCRTGVTDGSGLYRVQAPVVGKYRVTAFPPAGSNAVARTRRTITRVKAEVEATGQDVVLGVVKPPPPTVGFGGSGVRSKSAEGVPVVHWQEPFKIEYEADPDFEVEIRIEFPDGKQLRLDPELPPKPSPKDPTKGIFAFPVPPLFPNHGAGRVTVVSHAPRTEPEIEQEEQEAEDEETEEEEQEEEEEEETSFPIYIDPSGFVRTVDGAPLAGAKVTLFRSDAKSGPFAVVPDGSAVMSPMNRVNPDLSEASGHFGWDVIAGFYKVRVEKAGCHAPGAAGIPTVETAVMTIPPPVTNLDIRLQCDPAVAPISVLPAKPRPRISLRLPAGVTLKVGKDGRVKFKTAAVDCPAGAEGSCAADIAVTVPPPKKKKAGKSAAKALKVGAGKLTIAPGKSAAVEAKLSKSGLALLTRLKRLKATVTVKVAAPGTDGGSGSFRATLKPKPKPKKKS
jgi:hypothetical protein